MTDPYGNGHQASPLDGLQVSKELVLEFFAVFSRFEHALKLGGYCTSDRYGNANPDWKRFIADAAPAFTEIPDASADAIGYLLEHPPHRQVVRHHHLDWELPNYKEDATTALKVLDAVKTVRNNLFHGGKHAPHSPQGRDERLIRASLAVLYYCLNIADQVRIEYEGAY